MVMMLHCGGQHTDMGELMNIPLPEQTDTYVPVAHADMVTNITEIGNEFLSPKGFILKNQELATSHQGGRMFMLNTYFRVDNDQLGLSVAARNSYDKSMKAGFAIGAKVFVCDNLAMNGKIVHFHRHTGDVLRKLHEHIVLGFHQAVGEWTTITQDAQYMRLKGITDSWAMDIIADAFDHRLAEPKHHSRVVRQWLRPRAGFDKHTAWALYNAFTGTYKDLPISEVIPRHGRLHAFMMDAVKEI